MFNRANRRSEVSLAAPDLSGIGAITDLNKQLDRIYKAMVGHGKLQKQQHEEWTAEMGLLQNEILATRLKIASINKALENSLDEHVAKNREIRLLRELGGRRDGDRNSR